MVHGSYIFMLKIGNKIALRYRMVLFIKKKQKEPKLYRGKVSARLYKDGPIKSTETRPVGMYSRRLPYYRAMTQKKDKKPRIYASLLVFLFRAIVP